MDKKPDGIETSEDANGIVTDSAFRGDNPASPATGDEDVDLGNILAMYDTNDLVTKMEEAAHVLLEIVPFMLPVSDQGKAVAAVPSSTSPTYATQDDQEEHADIFLDALSVLCGDLGNILQVGLRDPSHAQLFQVLSSSLGVNEKFISETPDTLEDHDLIDTNSLTDMTATQEPLSPTDIIQKRKIKLYKILLHLLKDCRGLNRFLSEFILNESLIDSLYRPFAPLRNSVAVGRIAATLISLIPFYRHETDFPAPQPDAEVDVVDGIPKVEPKSPTSALSAAISSAPCSPPLHRRAEVAPEINTKKAVQAPGASSTLPLHPKTPVRQHSRSRSDGLPPTTPRSSPLQQAVSLRGSPGRTDTPNRSHSPMPQSSAYFSPPHPGQSLIGFLQTQDTETCADLERENAHFFICEAVISAVEQMHYERRHGRYSTMFRAGTSTDDEGFTDWSRQTSIISAVPGRLSVNGMASSSGSGTGTSSSFDEEEPVIQPSTSDPSNDRPFPLPPVTTSHSRQSSSVLPDAQPFVPPPPPTARTERTGTNASKSAESIAIALLRKFRDTQLPSASELVWLVSEQDVPQSSSSLLPLPRSTCIVPTEENQPHFSRIRGNLEWAPLRPQIIYHIQPHISLKLAMAQQKSRCAGCGGKMNAAQQARMRFCEYTGKYFCVCCHDYKTSWIPARILQKWDFSKHYVSNYAADFIGKIYRDPLFDVSDCNRDLYKRSKLLNQTRILRTQLVIATEYIKNCRQAASAVGEIQQLPRVVYTEVHTYSLEMFCSIRDGIFPTFLKPVADLAVQHVLQCKSCAAHGFICEFCRNETPIFPFQFSIVYQCPQCFACYHVNCFKKGPCPKCSRIEARHKAKLASSP